MEASVYSSQYTHLLSQLSHNTHTHTRLSHNTHTTLTYTHTHNSHNTHTCYHNSHIYTHTHTHITLSHNTHTQQEYISKPDNDVVLNVIDKDLDRTFPSHVLFQKSGSHGYVTNLHCILASTVSHSSSVPPGKQTSAEC